MFDLPIYCENNTSFLFNEPFNIITNLTFFVSAFFLFKRKSFFKEMKDPLVCLFFLMIIATGLGSTLFHSFRSTLTHALDFVPIYILFITLFYGSIRAMSNGVICVLSTLIFITVEVLIAQNVTRETLSLNGSINHLFTIFVFSIIIFLLKGNVKTQSGQRALKLFFMALMFRIIDLRVCETVNVGTHFLWHLLCGTAVYFSYLFLLECRRGVK